MIRVVWIGLTIFLFINACGEEPNQNQTDSDDSISVSTIVATMRDGTLINPAGQSVESRIVTPEGFERVVKKESSFEEYLGQLPLKRHGADVSYHNGVTKFNSNIYVAVVDLPIGSKDLHQCADAVIRLRADYLWNEKKYDKIHFNFTNGFRVNYIEWMKGKRIVVRGNKASWTEAGSPSNSYQDFWNYLEIIFTYAGTASLSDELEPVTVDDLRIGDLFIRGGSPGHTVIVVDLAQNRQTGQKIFLLAQSYMPAQEIQILANRNDKTLDPWYPVDFGDQLSTPEWIFSKTDLKRFVD